MYQHRPAAGQLAGGRYPGRSVRAARALTIELALLLAFLTMYELTQDQRGVTVQRVLLVLAGLAMGVPSAAVRHLGVTGLSTTYMTGTLTGVLLSLVGHRRDDQFYWWALARLLALLIGAGTVSLLIQTAPRAAPVLPVLAIMIVVVTTAISQGRAMPSPRK